MKRENFWDFYSQNDLISGEQMKTMPLCHNTNYESAESIFRDGEFRPSKCEVLGKKAVFFFYGKPFYFNEASMLAPVILAFKCKEEKFDDFEWFPIDSGSTVVLEELFPDFKVKVSSVQLKEEFNLSKIRNINYIKSHILFFFKNNNGYFNDNCVIEYDDLCDYCTNTNVFKVHQLFNRKQTQYVDRSKVYLDERVMSIEGHSDIAISLSDLQLVFFYGPSHQRRYILKKSGLPENAVISGGGYEPFTSSPIEQMKSGVEKFYNFLIDEQYVNESKD